MPKGVGVQVPPSALGTLPRRLMVGHQPLELSIVVRIHAGQQNFIDNFYILSILINIGYNGYITLQLFFGLIPLVLDYLV